MLISFERLLNQPVMSLQTAEELATTSDAIIDPRNLKIVALTLSGRSLDNADSVLHTSDIREISPLGLIIDDNSKLLPVDDLVRLQQIISFGFKLIGLPVFDESGARLGKVASYTFEPSGYLINQITTQQSILRNLTEGSKVINRSQIIYVSNKKIIARMPTVRAYQKSLKIKTAQAPQPLG